MVAGLLSSDRPSAEVALPSPLLFMDMEPDTCLPGSVLVKYVIKGCLQLSVCGSAKDLDFPRGCH